MSKRKRNNSLDARIEEAEKRFSLAETLHRTGNYQAALISLQSSIAISELPHHLNRHSLLGTLQYNVALLKTANNEFESAHVLLQDSILSYTNDITINRFSAKGYEGLVMANFILKNKKAAYEALAKAIKYGSEFSFIEKWVEQLGIKDKVIEGCEKYVAKALAIMHTFSKTDYEMLANIQECLLNLGKQTPDAYTSFGLTLQKTEDFKLMEKAFEKAISLDPGNFERRMDLVNSLSLTNRMPSKISKALMEAIGVASTREQIERIISDYIENNNRFGLIAEDAYFKLALIESENKSYDRVIIALNKALECNDNWVTYAKLGEVYCITEQFEKSLACNRKALEINPDFLEAKLNSVTCLAKLGRKAEAYEVLHAAQASPLYAANNDYVEFGARVGVLLDRVVESSSPPALMPSPSLTEVLGATYVLGEDEINSFLAGE